MDYAKYLARLALLCVTVWVLAACAASAPDHSSLSEKLARHGYRVVEPVDRIPRYRIDSWIYIDDHHVVLKRGPSAAHMLTFLQRCSELRGAIAIAYSTTVGNVTKFDDVFVRNNTGFPPQKCRIEFMHRLEKIK